MWEKCREAGRVAGRGQVSAHAWMGVLLALMLTGCASHRPTASAEMPPPAGARMEGRDATGAYRFNMTQHGRRMTADEFDAWMKARGIRVAKGASAKQAAPSSRTAAAAATAGGAKQRAQPATKAAAAPAAAVRQGKTGKNGKATTVATAASPAAKGKAKAATKPRIAQPVTEAATQAAKPPKRGEG